MKNIPTKDGSKPELNKLQANISEARKKELAEQMQQLKNNLQQAQGKSKSPVSSKPSHGNNKSVITEASKKDAAISTYQPALPKKLLLDKETAAKLMKYLRTIYPKCFTTPPSPLAIGIHNELVETDLVKDDTPLTTDTIHKILRIYTSSYAYKKQLVLDAGRLSLNGEVQSRVTKEHVTLGKQNKVSKDKDKSKNKNDDKNHDKAEAASDKALVTDKTANNIATSPAAKEQVKS